MTELDVERHSLMIDPHLHIWGWEVPVYLFLGGMAAGVMILSSWLMMRQEGRSPVSRWLAFAAPLLVTLGMGVLFLDLAYKLHVWRFYLAFLWTSPMSWGSWILVAVYPVSLAAAFAGLDDAQAGKAAAFMRRFGLESLAHALRGFALRHLTRLRWLNLGLGVALGVYTGILLSTLGTRALWNSALLGPLFLVSGLSTGAAFFLLFDLSEGERHLITHWDKLAIALEGVLLALFLVGLVSSDAAGKDAAALLLGGEWTAPFWSLVVIVGLAVPFLLKTLESRLRLRATVLAPVLVLVGGLALRWIMVAAGQD